MSKKRLSTLAAIAAIEDETDNLMAECFGLEDVQRTTSSSTDEQNCAKPGSGWQPDHGLNGTTFEHADESESQSGSYLKCVRKEREIMNVEREVSALNDACFGSTSDKDENERLTLDLAKRLKECFGENGLTVKAQTEIINIFREYGFPNLPCSRVITGSCTVAHLIEKCGDNGQMYYFGIADGVRATVTADYLSKCRSVNLDFFVDGLSPYKSSPLQLWPILCRLSATKFSFESVPFIVAVYSGTGSPLVSDLLKSFVEEARKLESNGMEINDMRYEVVIEKFIADYPARCLLKCVNGKGARSLVQCERCTARGKTLDYITHVSSTEVRGAELRTDASFRAKQQEEYHQGDSPLLTLAIDMLYSFPIDAMHLLYLGVARRFIEFMSIKKRCARYHINKGGMEEIHAYMEREFRKCFPCEFARRVKGLEAFRSYKATEWRRFVLYDGILVSKKFFPPGAYKLFLLLSCAVRILSSHELFTEENLRHDAHKLLMLFVGDAQEKFGKNFLVIKVHSLTHLVADCEKHGLLDSFSAFPFESYLCKINASMRRHGKCIEQIVARYMEGHLLQPVPVTMRIVDEPKPSLSSEMKCVGNVRHYQKAVFRNMHVRVNRQGDSFVKTCNNEVLKVTAFTHDGDSDEICVVGRKFKYYEDFFRKPIRSSVVGIQQYQQECWGKVKNSTVERK
ncbi:hypothetical protein FOCC_FOCC016271 [Frankliniella occidentalis]|nr:hypothetical protein FOCC_FOCC016271 [Frankliniella occidentalis]